MKTEDLEKFIKLLTAYKNGKKIQCIYINPREGKRYWEDIEDIAEISLQDEPESYRIKPKKQLD